MAKRNWKELVEKSKALNNPNQELQYVPEKLLEVVKPWQDKRVAFQKEVERLAKQENEISNMFNNMIFAIRKFYEDAGMEDIWTKDIDFQEEALKDGEYIIAIHDAEAIRKA